MSLFRRNEIWYASYSLPGGKRIKESLGTKDKRQAQELHDKRKAELWRVEKLGDLPDVTFEEACLRWLEEKADKKSLDSDKSRIEFWLEHFEGIRLKDISEAKIYSAVSRMHNRKTKEIWKQKVQAAIRKGKEPPVYEPKPVSTQTKAKHLAMIKAILRAAERDWKWLEKAPVIKIPAVRNKRVRWLEKEEAKRLIDECPEPLKSVVKFALATGLRKSNIINLEWQQIDMQRRVAWVNPEESKSNRAIGVALNDTACKVLRDQIGKHHKWVFVHTKAAKRAFFGVVIVKFFYILSVFRINIGNLLFVILNLRGVIRFHGSKLSLVIGFQISCCGCVFFINSINSVFIIALKLCNLVAVVSI